MRTKDWLKKARENVGLTQRELANKIGLSPFTIEQIEQGKRLGSTESWEKIENFLDGGTISMSYACDELIEEIQEDIAEFGKDHPCILVYKIIDNHIFFTNYDFIVEENPFNPEKELEEDEKFIKTTLQYAFEVFEMQNKIM